MLYVTTRNQEDAYTVAHVLSQNRGENGGLWVPMHFPRLSPEDLGRLSEMSFNQRVAQMLNLFFSTKLTGWDVDFCTGRYPVRVEPLAHRIHMAEFWHNPQWRYERLEQNLRQLLAATTEEDGNWVSVAIRMALLAGILGELNDGCVDIAAVSGDFTAVISACYLRKMGFPVGNIICCCNENKQLWNFICHGQLKFEEAVISAIVPEADVIAPVNLERLISVCGGAEETQRYLECFRTGSMYSPPEEVYREMRKGLYVSVVSSVRIETAIPNVYNSHHYLLTPASALAYSGIMDYRSKTGITRSALVLCDCSPVCEEKAVARAMNLSPEEIRKLI